MSKSHAAIFIIPAMFTLAACVETREPLAEASATAEAMAQPVLRVQKDLARGRRWELGWGTASVYDIATDTWSTRAHPIVPGGGSIARLLRRRCSRCLCRGRIRFA